MFSSWSVRSSRSRMKPSKNSAFSSGTASCVYPVPLWRESSATQVYILSSSNACPFIKTENGFLFIFTLWLKPSVPRTCPLTPAPFPLWFTKKVSNESIIALLMSAPLTGNLVGLSFDGDSSIKRFFEQRLF